MYKLNKQIQKTTFYAIESVKRVEGILDVIMKVACLERDRRWAGFMDRVRFQELPEIRDK